MTELGIVASVIQIADVGIRLSLKLYAFGEAVSSANRSIISISKDVSLTSSVLKELGQILDTDQNQGARLCSENAVQTANGIVTECKEVFQELDEILLKKLPHRSQGDKATRATLALERLKWPFIQPRIQLLRGHLDTLKSTLTLMLNVIMYAGQVRDRYIWRASFP